MIKSLAPGKGKSTKVFCEPLKEFLRREIQKEPSDEVRPQGIYDWKHFSRILEDQPTWCVRACVRVCVRACVCASACVVPVFVRVFEREYYCAAEGVCVCA